MPFYILVSKEQSTRQLKIKLASQMTLGDFFFFRLIFLTHNYKRHVQLHLQNAEWEVYNTQNPGRNGFYKTSILFSMYYH